MKQILTIALLLSVTFLKAQKTELDNVYYDNNGQITLSWLSTSPAQLSSLNGVILDTAANVYMHYPVYGQVAVTTENNLYRITIWNIYFQTENLALPVEMFAKRGRNKIRDKKAVRLIERQLRSKFIK